MGRWFEGNRSGHSIANLAVGVGQPDFDGEGPVAFVGHLANALNGPLVRATIAGIEHNLQGVPRCESTSFIRGDTCVHPDTREINDHSYGCAGANEFASVHIDALHDAVKGGSNCGIFEISDRPGQLHFGKAQCGSSAVASRVESIQFAVADRLFAGEFFAALGVTGGFV